MSAGRPGGMTEAGDPGAVVFADTAGGAVDLVAGRLAEAGIATARLDARVLVAAALSVEPTRVFSHPETPLRAGDKARLAALLRRREQREPVARIVGRKEFWSLPFELAPQTLVPRPETETVVEAVLDLFQERRRRLRVLDLGTGSGCLLLALLAEFPEATGIGTDIDVEALAVARINAERNGLAGRAQFRAGDWWQGVDGGGDRRFDVIVSNPPYVAEDDIDGLEPEVARFDPRRALSGGADGLDAYRRILADARQHLAAGGRLVFEIGQGQADAVVRLAGERALACIATRCDLAGVERVVALAAAEPGSVKKTVGIAGVPD